MPQEIHLELPIDTQHTSEELFKLEGEPPRLPSSARGQLESFSEAFEEGPGDAKELLKMLQGMLCRLQNLK